MFKVCARTVLELGAELISSDIIAFYELVKNSFDAQSPNGAEIHFEIVLRRNSYLKFRQRAISDSEDLDELKSDINNALESSASKESISRFKKAIQSATDTSSLINSLDHSYDLENRIIISDEGLGMSRSDLTNNYLVIGTPSRKKAVEDALNKKIVSDKGAPYLGEKGIGRLSAMRLGETLIVETAQEKDKQLNELQIDWGDFSDLEKMLEEIQVKPKKGGIKPSKKWSGTRLIIGRLAADWTHKRLVELADNNFARLTDPFSLKKKRPRIALFWNGTRTPIARLDKTLLEHAHASVRGKFIKENNELILKCKFEALDLGFKHPYEEDERNFSLPDLEGLIAGTKDEILSSALHQLGEFSFEAYWFNRRRLGGIDSIGNQQVVRNLQKRWSGIPLYRDRFRVLPYGEDEDDWLAMDRKALATSSYLLNKSQFVGHVNISRLGNPDLIDQTNREGLRVCPEQEAFIELLKFSIQDQLGEFLRDFEKRYKGQPIDLGEAKTEADKLVKRTKDALKKIKRMAPKTAGSVDKVEQEVFAFQEIYDQAQQRISEVENENQQMIQMAGVGLLVEVVAHELARSTENALSTLEALRKEDIPKEIKGLLISLQAEMKSVNKRIRVLDPLSVSGKQRKEGFDLVSLVEDVLSGHAVQFKRHNVKLEINAPKKKIRIKAVKGMVVQIVENLVSNSLYWLDIRSKNEYKFKPRITINFNQNPLGLTFEDNGRGIAPENRDRVFRAFYSLKEKSKRRGLGLYIGRDCARHHGGELYLDEKVTKETGRLNRFIFELPDELSL